MTRTVTELVRHLEATRDETLAFFELEELELDRTYGPSKWSVRFLLHHLADTELVCNERIRRVLSERTQVLMVFEQDDWAKALEYSRMPLDLSRDVFASVRRSAIYLARQYYTSRGHLPWVHSQLGPRTLRDEFDKVADHNALHLGHIRAALG